MKVIINYHPEGLTIPANAKIKVSNLASPRTGEPVKNQFCIRIPLAGIVKFQSYNTLCASYDLDCKVLTLYPAAFGYSVTTSKYTRAFLENECGIDADEARLLFMQNRDSIGEDCPLYIQI